jgi:hypothetical protein
MDSLMVDDPVYALYWPAPKVAGVYAAFFLQRKKNPFQLAGAAEQAPIAGIRPSAWPLNDGCGVPERARRR